MTFAEKMRLRLVRTGQSYDKLCREMGSHGGKKAAANKRARRHQEQMFHEEQRRQVTQGLTNRDAVPDAIFTEAERRTIAFESVTAPQRVTRLCPEGPFRIS